MYQLKPRRWFGRAAMFLSIASLPVTTLTAAEVTLEEVVVTGSFIKGTPEDSSLPVDVLTRKDLEDVGNPTILEMVRNLGVASGNLGETNQFQAGNEGVSTVNLRGLGAARTLVLLNTKRHVATEVVGVDISVMPSIAISRVEVLKDGAAALYGSDAIGGVVNFITRNKFEGIEFRASHQSISDSDGDNSLGVIFGRSMDNVHFSISAEYETRDELPIKERDWALQSYADNPQAGWSGIGNPGSIFPAFGPAFPGNLLGGGQADPSCNLLGGFQDGGTCRFQYTFFDNLIEEQETIKIFGEVNVDISDTLSFHFEALWADMDIPAWKTSPSYPPQSLFGPDRYVSASHPGLIDLKAQNPGFFNNVGPFPAAAQGAFVNFRMLGVAGRNGQPEQGVRQTETKRISGGFEGEFANGISFDASLSWSERDRTSSGSDMYIERMALALDGLGGPNCDAAANLGTRGANGCEYYNPFSNAIQTSAVSGAVNPQYNAALANSDSLINWLTARTQSGAVNELLVLDLIFSGESTFELGGGNIGWAAGVQARSESYDSSLADIANRAINPCPFVDPVSVTLGHVATLDCGASGAGRLAFLAATELESTSRDIYGVFAEFALPVTDSLNVQLALRYEDYGDHGGSTVDPKIAYSWELSETFKLRGSASTTFRGPPQSFLGGTSTTLTFIPAALAFKAVDINGNSNLEAETAVALNFGAIWATGDFYSSIDYWSFDFEDSFQTESAAQIIGAYSANGCQDGGAGVGTSSCDSLRARITPDGIPAAGLQRVDTNIINGSNIQTSGVDVAANYTFSDVVGGDLNLSLEGTYVLEYKSDDFTSLEGFTLAPGGDFVGKLNDGDPFTPKPEFKGSLSARWSNDSHRFNYNLRYVDSYEDVRPGLPTFAEIDNQVTHDVHYINNMIEDLTLSLSLINITDEDPPVASVDLGYDAYTHSPFGRMFKLGIAYQL
ncbi:MAG: iron complex outermembrane receptor protein [Flavobacterium sp.]|jgi:iron complex outermembrane receptor protein